MLYIVECQERIIASSEYLVEAEDEKMARSVLMHGKRKSIIERMETIEEVIQIKKILGIELLDDASKGKDHK